jgi:HEAT repeat protein
MKVNMQQFAGYLAGLRDGDGTARRAATSSLAKYTDAEWEGAPEAVEQAVEALLNARRQRGSASLDAPSRADAAKTLGNIGTRNKAVLPELLRYLREDADNTVRAEAARALGKIGAAAVSAGASLVDALQKKESGDALRCEAARSLARTDPQGTATRAALRTATSDRSGAVAVCAAEALWRATGEPDVAAKALVARLRDGQVRAAAAQVLYRMDAVPALLAAAKDKDRLFRESVVMALQNIDPRAAAKAGVK